MKSNFSFVENIDKKCFDKLIDVEKRAKYEPYRIGTYIRQVMEYLCFERAKDYQIVDFIKEKTATDSPDLYTQLNVLRDKDGSVAEYVKNNSDRVYQPLPAFNIRFIFGKKNRDRFLPVFVNEELNTEANVAKFQWADNFLRQIGNDFVHDESHYYDKVFKREYKNVIYALKTLQEYVRRFYNADRADVPYFNEDIMPVASYEIIKAYVPSDSFRTGCEKEFVAKRYEGADEECVGYSLLRQYSYTADNSILLKRATDVYRMGDNCGALLNKVVIVTQNVEETPLYIIAYDFKTKAEELNTEFLSTLTLRERISLCLSYARTLSYFHNNCPPMYHRLLSSKSAYYADERGKYNRISTALVKFEYAKISDCDFSTVLKDGPDDKYLSQLDEMRYIPAEWTTLKNPVNEDWARVDVYSLGVLFTDILMGKIGGYSDNDVMKNKELAPVMELLSVMSDRAEERPDIDKVVHILEEILKNEN